MGRQLIVECRNIVKSYPADGSRCLAVDHVSFSVAAGDFVFVHGHSGSGKTTLLSLIGGLTTPDSGQVVINGRDSQCLSDNDLTRLRNLSIGFVFQFASLLPTLTVLENILLPLSFGNRSDGQRQAALDLLAKVGLPEKINSLPGQLSGGQQRRVAIARAFINRPEIILADEPSGDLDEETEQEIFDLFTSYGREHNSTFLVVSHNRELAERIPGSRVFTMHRGKLVEEPRG